MQDDGEGYNQAFGERVRNAREKRGWSQRRLAEELAEKIGVKLDPSAVTRIERGTREAKLREAVALAMALRVPLQDLARPPAGSPYDQLKGSLESADERRNAARHAFGGMSHFYTSIVNILESNPELLQNVSASSVNDFLRQEALRASESAKPHLFLYLDDEKFDLVAKIIEASTERMVAKAVDDDDDDDGLKD